MSKFRDYLTSTNQTQRSFARRIGISENYLSEIATGVRLPSLTVAYDIHVASDGVIPMTYWRERDDLGRGTSHTANPKSSENKETRDGYGRDG